MLLELRHVCKDLAGRTVLFQIELALSQGDRVAIHALNPDDGQMLIDIIAGRTVPTSGDILLVDQPLITLSRDTLVRLIGVRERIAQAYTRLSVGAYLALFAELFDVPTDRRVEVTNGVGLLDRLAEPIKGLNPGLLARVNLARACLHKPALLLLERPTAGLDVETTELLRRLILNESAGGTGVMVITDSLEEAESLGQRVYQLRGGALEEMNPKPEAISEEPDGGDVDPRPQRVSARKVVARVNDRTILFDPTEIVYISSQDGQTTLHIEGAEAPCPLTLADLETRLQPFGFFRCHRSYIVNLQRVREIVPWTRSSFSLVLDDRSKTTVPLSKSAAKELEELLGLKT